MLKDLLISFDTQGFMESLRGALQENDLAFCRKAIFKQQTGPLEVTPRVADALATGYKVPGAQGFMPFAALCFMHGAAALFRDVVGAKHPKFVAGVDVTSSAAWLQFLAVHSKSSPTTTERLNSMTLALATIGFASLPKAPDFLAILLDYAPDEADFATLEREFGVVWNSLRMTAESRRRFPALRS